MIIPEIKIDRNEWAISCIGNGYPVIKTDGVGEDTVITILGKYTSCMARIGNDTQLETIREIFEKIPMLGTNDNQEDIIAIKVSESPPHILKLKDYFPKLQFHRYTAAPLDKNKSIEVLIKYSTDSEFRAHLKNSPPIDLVDEKDYNTKPLTQVTKIQFPEKSGRTIT